MRIKIADINSTYYPYSSEYAEKAQVKIKTTEVSKQLVEDMIKNGFPEKNVVSKDNHFLLTEDYDTFRIKRYYPQSDATIYHSKRTPQGKSGSMVTFICYDNQEIASIDGREGKYRLSSGQLGIIEPTNALDYDKELLDKLTKTDEVSEDEQQMNGNSTPRSSF